MTSLELRLFDRRRIDRSIARPTRRSAASAWACVLCWLLCPSFPTLAQPPVEPADDASTGDFFEVVNVQIANIDVWVTDKDGDPVSGLDKSDFVVTRDGKTVEIANFYAVSGGRPTATLARRDASSEPDSKDRSRTLECTSSEYFGHSRSISKRRFIVST